MVKKCSAAIIAYNIFKLLKSVCYAIKIIKCAAVQDENTISDFFFYMNELQIVAIFETESNIFYTEVALLSLVGPRDGHNIHGLCCVQLLQKKRKVQIFWVFVKDEGLLLLEDISVKIESQ